MCLAIPGKILTVQGTDPLWREGRVDFSGVVKAVNLACVPEAGIGSFVLVHAGMAISVVDEEEAEAMLEHFRQIGEATAPEADDGFRANPAASPALNAAGAGSEPGAFEQGRP